MLFSLFNKLSASFKKQQKKHFKNFIDISNFFFQNRLGKCMTTWKSTKMFRKSPQPSKFTLFPRGFSIAGYNITQ